MTPPDLYGRALALWCALVAGLLAIGGVSAHAQPMPVQDGPRDEWTMEREAEDWYRVHYYNAYPAASWGAPRHLTVGGMVVGLSLEATSGPEHLTVTPPEGWLAIPERITVEDGQIGVIDVIRVQDWQGM